MAKNPAADALIRFIDDSPSPFHAVATATRRLQALGSTALDETKPWSLAAGGMFHFQRNASSLIAFRLPAISDDPSAIRFSILAAHTDSPCLKLKPKSPDRVANYRQWGVEVYGGVLLNSWLDRELDIAGKLTLCHKGLIRTALVRIRDGHLRIPQLAIHLDRGVNDNGLVLNPQRHMQPLLGLSPEEGRTLDGEITRLAREAFPGYLPGGEGPDRPVLAFDLLLHDANPPCYGGLDDEFLYAPRLDNLAMSHAALEAFCATDPAGAVQVVALFDNEEVGSISAQGANSNLLPLALERVVLALGGTREDFLAAAARSFLISADMAHALHPNYPERHEPNHFPLLNGGPVLKANANLRYASDSESGAYFQGLCRDAGVPAQNFINRTDLACGTTIGPHLAASLGIPTVDVGNPMLSMHSIREMCGSEDHGMMIRVFREFFGRP